MSVEYLGTKVGISRALYPKEYKQQVIEIDSKPYDMVQRIDLLVDRSKVIKSSELETFTELVNKVGEEVLTKLKGDFDDRHNFESFAIIKHIDNNIKGANAFKKVDVSYIVKVEIHIRKEEPKPKKLEKPTKEQVEKALVKAKTTEKPKKVLPKKDKAK